MRFGRMLLKPINMKSYLLMSLIIRFLSWYVALPRISSIFELFLDV